MCVHNKFPESDHLPISIKISCNVRLDSDKQIDRNSSWVQLEKYKWDHSNLHLYERALYDTDSLTMLDQFFDSVSMLQPCEDVAMTFMSYVQFAADKVFPKVLTKPPPQIKENPWFEGYCNSLREKVIANPLDKTLGNR